MVMQALDLYRRVYEELLAVPVIMGESFTPASWFDLVACVPVCRRNLRRCWVLLDAFSTFGFSPQRGLAHCAVFNPCLPVSLLLL